METTREAFGAEFDGADGFLDTATYGVPPRFVADGMRECLQAWQHGRLELSAFVDAMAAGRAAYAALIGVDPQRVATGSSASSVIGLVAASIPDGSRVATLPGEYTSVTFPFAAQAGRGLTITELPLGPIGETAPASSTCWPSVWCSPRTARVLNVEALQGSLAGSDTVTLIDVTQSLGWRNDLLPWADVTVGVSYKWLLGPRGVAWMSLSDRMFDSLVPQAANPFATEDVWSSLYGLPMRLAEDGRRFDSSPAWFSVFGAGLSLPWLASLNRAAVHAHTVGLANRLRAELQLPAVDSAIVSIPGSHSTDALAAAGIRAAVRAGAVRVAFHIYNTEEDLDRLLDALSR